METRNELKSSVGGVEN